MLPVRFQKREHMPSLYLVEALESRVLLSVSAPTSLMVVSRTETTIGLRWTQPPGAIKGFHLIEYLNQIGGQPVTLPPGQTSDLVTGLRASSGYSFEIRAFDDTGDSIGGATVGVGTVGSRATAPSSIMQTAAGPRSVTLSWVDNSGDATGFKIERSQNPSDFSDNFPTIATLPATARTYTDRTAAPGEALVYRVIAVNPFGQSPAPLGVNQVFITLPLRPTHFTLAGASATSLQLQWTPTTLNSSTGAFIIQQSVHGKWRMITQQDHFVGTYTVTGLAPRTRYSFRIMATNDFGSSRHATYLSAKTTSAAAALPAPTGLVVASTAPTLAMLQFQDASPAIDHFTIESLDETNFGVWKAEGVTSASHSLAMASYLVTGLVPGIKYDFRVTAVNGHSVSAPASIVFTMPTFSALTVAMPSGKVVAAFNNATFSYTNTGERHWTQEVGVSRTNPDGTPDATFGVGGRVVLGTYVDLQGNASLERVLVKPDGSIFASGFDLTNISSDGTVLGSTRVFLVPYAMTPNGELLVGGLFAPNKLALYRGDLTLDPTFGNAGVLTLPGDGKVTDLSILTNGLTALTLDSNRVVLLDAAGNVFPTLTRRQPT